MCFYKINRSSGGISGIGGIGGSGVHRLNWSSVVIKLLLCKDRRPCFLVFPSDP